MSLTFQDCTYRYGRKLRPVLDDFSYRLPGGLTILLGPNGAGKSTLLKLAASVDQPQSGRVDYGRHSSRSRAYRRHVSWMPQNVPAMAGLTAREQVAYVGWLKGMNRTEAWDRALETLTLVNLREHADTKASTLSGGQLRRVGVASALVHECRVLLLDEPTAGMDPRQRRVFRDLLRGLSGDVDVLMSTHDVADLAEEADHVTVLYGGKVLQTGSTEAFLAHTPLGAAPGRAAEAAYTALLTGYETE
ncbi:ABC transporter ATP-binding protein [Streptomyces blattellae]|uniref:ABC transporter ATP-binding protein n=1 Tax=Streptomyces blattellae TaxID=2569855 RepID=UPI001E2CA420|nr:ATP-binding cassette domain-containing protein [Streptomyces blattellae]